MKTIDARASRPNLSGYDRASLLIVWAYDRAEGVQLVFGRMELLPTEMGRTTTKSLINPEKLPGKKQTRTLYAGVVDMSATEGLEWYERALGGEWNVPHALVPGLEHPPYRPLGGAAEEPAQRQLVLPIDDN